MREELRRDPVYISTEVFRGMLILSKARSGKIEKITVDKLVDNVCYDFLKANHPKILQHLRDSDKQQNEVIKEIQKDDNSTGKSA